MRIVVRARIGRLVSRGRARLARRTKRRAESDRARFVEQARELTPVMAVERGRTRYLLPVREKAGSDRFTKTKWKETRHLERALAVLDSFGWPRLEFVDVGAHVGTTAIAAVQEFGFRSAVAFEPELENFRLLQANRGINGLEASLSTFNAAVSDRVGTAELVLGSSRGTKHRLLRRGEAGRRTRTVRLTTLDALVDAGELDPSRVSLLWLDVEGHELEALSGAQKLLDRAVPIVMEFTPRRLAAGGGLEDLRSCVGDRYTRVVDLRRPRSGALELDRLGELARRYRRGFTDILLFGEHDPQRARRAA